MVHSPPRKAIEAIETVSSPKISDDDMRSRVAMVHSPPRKLSETASAYRKTPASPMPQEKEHCDAKTTGAGAPAASCEAASVRSGRSVEVQLLGAAYGCRVTEQACVSLCEEFPELKWISSCIPLCPLPPGWISGECEGGRIQYVNTEAGTQTETPPMLEAFADLARLMLDWRGDPSCAGKVGAAFDAIRDKCKDDALRVRIEWSGPHVDPSSGVEYFHNADLGRSCWGDPGMAPDFIAAVADRLRQALPIDITRSVNNRRGWLPDKAVPAQTTDAAHAPRAPDAPTSGRSRRPGSTINMRMEDRTPRGATNEAAATVAALHQACGPTGSSTWSSIRHDIAERKLRLKLAEGSSSTSNIARAGTEEDDDEVIEYFGKPNSVVREASAEIRAPQRPDLRGKLRASSRDKLASPRDKLESLNTPRKQVRFTDEQAEVISSAPERPMSASRPLSARRSKSKSLAGSPDRIPLNPEDHIDPDDFSATGLLAELDQACKDSGIEPHKHDRVQSFMDEVSASAAVQAEAALDTNTGTQFELSTPGCAGVPVEVSARITPEYSEDLEARAQEGVPPFDGSPLTSPVARPTSPSIMSVGDASSPKPRGFTRDGVYSPKENSPPNSPSILVLEDPPATWAVHKPFPEPTPAPAAPAPVTTAEPKQLTQPSPRPKKRGVKLGVPQPLSARGELRLMEEMLREYKPKPLQERNEKSTCGGYGERPVIDGQGQHELVGGYGGA